VTVSSEPQKFLLYLANEKKVDVNNDKVYDISIILNKIESNKANLTIKAISEPVSEETTKENTQTETTESTSAQISQTGLSGITGAVIGGIKNNKIPFAIGFVIVVVIAGAVSLSYIYRKKERK